MKRLFAVGLMLVSASPALADRTQDLVQSCTGCHQGFAGSRIGNGWYAPSLRPDPRLGLGLWSEDRIVEYLRTGRNALAAAAGPMADIVVKSTSHMSQADLEIIAHFLKNLPPEAPSGTSTIKPSAAVWRAGEAIYQDNCTACHGSDGSGVRLLFPALAGNPAVVAPDPATILQIIVHGAQAPATDDAPTGSAMPAFGAKLDNQAVAAVASYLRSRWGNEADAVSESAVEGVRPPD